MKTITRQRLAGLFLSTLVAFHAAAGQEAIQPAVDGNVAVHAAGVLILQNGRLLKGYISRQGERFCVEVDGGEIWVPLGDVAHCCRSLEEAYQAKRSTMAIQGAYEHLQLAQWCLRHSLESQAAAELLAARQIDATHPLSAIVERQLRLCQGTGSSAAMPVPAGGAVQRAIVSATTPSGGSLVRSMPPGTVRVFTESVQPLLVKNCAVSGCHALGSGQQLELMRLPSGAMPIQRITERNLQAILPWISHERPAESPLLEAAVRAHGSAGKPPFADTTSEQYQRIASWVRWVAERPVQPGPMIAAAPMRDRDVHPASHEEAVDPFDPDVFNSRYSHGAAGSAQSGHWSDAAPDSPRDGSGGISVEPNSSLP